MPSTALIRAERFNRTSEFKKAGSRFLRQNKEIEKLMSISKDIIKDGAVSSDGADPSKRNMHLKTLMKVA